MSDLKSEESYFVVAVRPSGTVEPRVFGFKTQKEQLGFCQDLDDTFGDEAEFIYSKEKIPVSEMGDDPIL